MRRLYYFGSATDEKSGALYAAIEAATEPLLITICSNGGEAAGAAAVAHAIRNARVHVHTYAITEVCSAAVDIFLAGHTRGMHPATIAMTHASSGFESNRERDAYQRTVEPSLQAHLPYVQANYAKFFGKKSKYWTAEQFKEMGLVHYLAPTPMLNEFYGEVGSSDVAAPGREKSVDALPRG